MNTKLDIIHGDLHLNNTTLYYATKSYIIETKPDYTNMYVSYAIEEDVFLLKYNGFTGTVIDFSESLIIPKEPNLELMEEQINRIINFYDTLFPDFIKTYKVQLKTKLEDDFNKVFKIFSAIDMYIHTDRLDKYIKKYPIIQTVEKVKALVAKVNNISLKYLKVVMKDLVTDSLDIDKIKYPNYDIILQCFSDYIVKSKHMNSKKIKVKDMYFYNNNMRYSLSEYEKLPPRIKYMKIKKPNEPGVVDIADLINSHNVLRNYYKYHRK